MSLTGTITEPLVSNTSAMPYIKTPPLTNILITIFLILSLVVYPFGYVYAQSLDKAVAWAQILPLITFIIAIGTGVFNLYLMNKLGKQREEILKIVRSEFKLELENVVTKKDIEHLQREIKLQFENMSLQIKLNNKQSA